MYAQLQYMTLADAGHAQKLGSRSLCRALQDHGSLLPMPVKEVLKEHVIRHGQHKVVKPMTA
eukprot:2494021-Amphidinium_carterae.2